MRLSTRDAKIFRERVAVVGANAPDDLKVAACVFSALNSAAIMSFDVAFP